MADYVSSISLYKQKSFWKSGKLKVSSFVEASLISIESSSYLVFYFYVITNR